MMRISIILLVVGFSLAFSAAPDFETRHGFRVYIQGETTQARAEIERTTDIAIDIVSALMAVPRETVARRMTEARYELYVRERRYGDEGSCPSQSNPKRRCYGFVCGELGTDGWCEGYFSAYLRRVDYVTYECIADSALAHELIHFIDYLVHGFVENEHADARLFPEACVPIEDLKSRRECYRSSAERVIQRAVRAEICGSASR